MKSLIFFFYISIINASVFAKIHFRFPEDLFLVYIKVDWSPKLLGSKSVVLHLYMLRTTGPRVFVGIWPPLLSFLHYLYNFSSDFAHGFDSKMAV